MSFVEVVEGVIYSSTINNFHTEQENLCGWSASKLALFFTSVAGGNKTPYEQAETLSRIIFSHLFSLLTRVQSWIFRLCEIQALRCRLPLLWRNLHAVRPQDVALAPRLWNLKQPPLQWCWSLHPHTNESFSSRSGFVHMRVFVWKRRICSWCSELKTPTTNRKAQVCCASNSSLTADITAPGPCDYSNNERGFFLSSARTEMSNSKLPEQLCSRITVRPCC